MMTEREKERKKKIRESHERNVKLVQDDNQKFVEYKRGMRDKKQRMAKDLKNDWDLNATAK